MSELDRSEHGALTESPTLLPGHQSDAPDLPGGLVEAQVLRTHQWIERDGTRLEPLEADTRPRALEARAS